jgi:hypothetical protein
LSPEERERRAAVQAELRDRVARLRAIAAAADKMPVQAIEQGGVEPVLRSPGDPRGAARTAIEARPRR